MGTLRVGRLRVGTFVGAKFWSRRSWRAYGIFFMSRRGKWFSIGPVMFWKADVSE